MDLCYPECTEVAAIIPIITQEASYRCGSCSPSQRSDAPQELRQFFSWWLCDDQRKSWEVQTIIDGRQGKQNNADAIFKIDVAGKVVPVFLILIQHENTYQPHYQLQAPHGDLFTQVKRGPLQRAQRAVCSCDEEIDPFRVIDSKGKKKRSVPFEDCRRDSVRRTIQKAISDLVTGIKNGIHQGSSGLVP